jgi:PhnB protein
MSDEQTPAGWSTITPRIVTPDVGGLVAFVVAAFGAKGELVSGRPCELRIGNSMLMVSDGGGLRPAMPAFLHLYVADVDTSYARAVKAGAHAIEVPADMPLGDRRATVADDWGDLWQLATYRRSSKTSLRKLKADPASA